MRFSVIMASYLGDYRTAASDRENKIVRAIFDVMGQAYQDFELIVVADGCQKTIDIVSQIENPKLSYHLIPKAKQWSGEPRNKGLQEAKGEYILYLDIDDRFGENHLKNIDRQLNGYDWVWFDDVRYNSKEGQWYENTCDINKISMHGTSNICHKRTMSAKWDHVGYAHDYYFVLQLKQSRNFTKIEGGEYYVCHIPGGPSGYDL